MAYAKSYEWIFEQIRARSISAYTILDETKKTTLAEGDELTPDTVIADLQSILPHLGGMVYLVLSPKSKREKAAGGAAGSNMVIPVQLGTSTAAPVQGIGSTTIPGSYTPEQVEKLLAEREAKHMAELQRVKYEYETERKFAEMERRIKEASETNPLVDKFAPAINGILAHYFSPKTAAPVVAVAGLADADTDAPGAEVNPILAQMEADIDRLLAVDPDFPEVLHRLAHMAETNPGMYNTAKSMLPPIA